MGRENNAYYDRARQPVGYGPDGRRRRPAAPWPGNDDGLGARQVPPQGRHVYSARGEAPRTGTRSRLLAVVALVAVALVILVTGLAISSGSPSGSEAIPFELLPFPQDAVTSTTQ